MGDENTTEMWKADNQFYQLNENPKILVECQNIYSKHEPWYYCQNVSKGNTQFKSTAFQFEVPALRYKQYKPMRQIIILCVASADKVAE
jgi:hypothetical protein